MTTTPSDTSLFLFGSAEDETAYNNYLSNKLDERTTNLQPAIPHDKVGANLSALLEQLKKKCA